jgi:outer membrane immunogenic protein
MRCGLRVVGAALLALAASPAMAEYLENVDVRPQARKLSAAWNWNGIYLGGNIGYSWGNSDTNTVFFDSHTNASLFATNSNTSLNGPIGGGQLGINWQSGTWLFGLETDIQASRQKGDTSLVCSTANCTLIPVVRVDGNAPPPPGPVSDIMSQKLSWLGTARARTGFTLTPVILAYVTGGLAYGEVESSLTLAGTNLGVPVSTSASYSTLKAGWTIGTGIEALLTGNWTGRIEYLHVNLGTVSGGPLISQIPSSGGGLVAANFSSRVTDNILRFGINYKFGGGPVRTK